MRSFWFSSVILLNAMSKSLHEQPLLNYLSRHWQRWEIERRQVTTTLHGILQFHLFSCIIFLWLKINSLFWRLLFISGYFVFCRIFCTHFPKIWVARLVIQKTGNSFVQIQCSVIRKECLISCCQHKVSFMR